MAAIVLTNKDFTNKVNIESNIPATEQRILLSLVILIRTLQSWPS